MPEPRVITESRKLDSASTRGAEEGLRDRVSGDERVSERVRDEALEATLGPSMRGGSMIKQIRRACEAKHMR